MSKLSFVAAAAALLLVGVPASSAWAQTAPAPATKSAPAAKPAASKMSAGRAAAIERQRKCGAEWKAAKAAGKIEKGMRWPKYWSACNKRLKGA